MTLDLSGRYKTLLKNQKIRSLLSILLLGGIGHRKSYLVREIIANLLIFGVLAVCWEKWSRGNRCFLGRRL